MTLLLCTLSSDNTNKQPIKKVRNHYYLNTANGFNYLYNSYPKSNNVYAVIYRNNSGEIHVADIDIRQQIIISDEKLPILPTEPVDEVIIGKNYVLLTGKKMTNEDYNIGEIYIKRIPL